MKYLRKYAKNKKLEQIIRKMLIIAAILTLALEWTFPQHSASAASINGSLVNTSLIEDVSLPQVPAQNFPENNLRSARYSVKIVVTAYSSTIDQTDDTPFITASGEVVHDGIVGANWLPLGAQIRIPEYFGDKVFVVEDRMNERFSRRVDIWMLTREQAEAWGLQYLTVEVL
ncbi:MAG: hypothetical protein V1712_03095 [Patescibacteria group bacterium]